MRVSIRDIARVAKVSHSTVSRALADSPLVNRHTKERIIQLAKEMGYTPNAVARSLATNRTHKLGIMVLDVADPYISQLVREIDKVALESGYRLILAHCGHDSERALASINMLLQERVDAVIVPDPAVSDSYLPLLDDGDVPVIVINRDGQPYVVGTDNTGAARHGVDYLMGLGHTCIAYIGSSLKVEESQERQVGYEEALRNRNTSPEPSLIEVSTSRSSLEAGRRSMKRLLSLSRPPTAVFCYNDLTAIGAMGAIHGAGLRVPEDVSVLGFNDISLSAYLTPALSSIAQQKERLAQLSVDLALDLLAGNEEARRELLPGRLVVRDSTAPPRVKPRQPSIGLERTAMYCTPGRPKERT